MAYPQALLDRIYQPDLAALPDWQVAQRLNEPDPSLPARVEWRRTVIGPGTILDTLGPAPGAAFLDAVQAASSTDAVLRWGLAVLAKSELDLSLASTRDALNGLQTAGLLSVDQLGALLGLARHERHPSWAEHLDMTIDARVIGLARGGI